MFNNAALRVFAPDEAFVGAFPLADRGVTTIAPPAGSSAGEYVLLLSQGGRNARVITSGASMRVLGQEFVAGEPQTGDTPGHDYPGTITYAERQGTQHVVVWPVAAFYVR